MAWSLGRSQLLWGQALACVDRRPPPMPSIRGRSGALAVVSLPRNGPIRPSSLLGWRCRAGLDRREPGMANCPWPPGWHSFAPGTARCPGGTRPIPGIGCQLTTANRTWSFLMIHRTRVGATSRITLPRGSEECTDPSAPGENESSMGNRPRTEESNTVTPPRRSRPLGVRIRRTPHGPRARAASIVRRSCPSLSRPSAMCWMGLTPAIAMRGLVVWPLSPSPFTYNRFRTICPYVRTYSPKHSLTDS